MASAPPPPAPAPPAAEPATPDGLFAHALRQALRDGRGRVVLYVEEPAAHRRKVARALLQEGALAAGGQVLDGPGGELLLVGAEAGRGARLCSLLERLVGPAAIRLLSIERDAAALRSYANGGAAPAPRTAGDGPGLIGLDAFLDSMPLATAVRRLDGWPTLGGDRPAFLRIEPDRTRLAAALGALGDDADVLDHAARRLAARLLEALSDRTDARALLGRTVPTRLHLPLPPDFHPEPIADGAPGRLVATVPLSDMADPEALARRRAELAAAGIALEIDGLDVTSIALLDAASLPAELIRLRWSPALETRRMDAALARIGPARLVLTGGTRAAARRLGVALLELDAT